MNMPIGYDQAIFSLLLSLLVLNHHICIEPYLPFLLDGCEIMKENDTLSICMQNAFPLSELIIV